MDECNAPRVCASEPFAMRTQILANSVKYRLTAASRPLSPLNTNNQKIALQFCRP